MPFYQMLQVPNHPHSLALPNRPTSTSHIYSIVIADSSQYRSVGPLNIARIQVIKGAGGLHVMSVGRQLYKSLL